MHRFFLELSTRVRSCVLLTAALLLAGSLPASAQGPGFDLFHTSSDTSTWSVNPQAGYPQPTRFPSGGFFINQINEIQNPPNIHIIIVATLSPAQPTGPGTAADIKPMAGLIAAQTKAAIQPSGASTLLAPELSDTNAGVACPSDFLEWTSVTGATSYQIWYRQLQPTPDPTYFEVYDGTALSLTITVPRGFTREYVAAACDAQGCSGFSNGVPVSEGNCP